ncbi:unnamed protein product [Owenia fusiformis]|uniref:Uncharacterized protein n=1 Tax=Owenia fusiformis TaxID=6347 RepID=A0A8J1UMM4_OWEFU|nr:unnamed protein product [Owenia fusiformis]
MQARRRRTNSGSEQENKENYLLRTNGQGYTQKSFTPPPPGAPPIQRDREMSGRDRTNEFLSACKSMQGRMGNGMNGAAKSHREPLRQRSQFTQLAKRIGQDIAKTFAKLEKLTYLAKKKSLFDDRPVEIQELTYIIKQDIGSLNKQIAQLSEFVRSQKYNSGKHVQTHSNTVVFALQSKLASMSNDFKSVLELRTENLKHQKARRDEFSESSNAPVTTMPPTALQGYNGSVLLQDEAQSKGEISIDMMEKDKYQQQLQLIEQQDTYIQSRAETMQNIESTIVELGSIFQQLAHMVHEQEDMVQRIDANVEDTQMNVEAAHGELLKYFQKVTSNRWLMIKIFGVLIVFFIIFVVFMA